MKNKTNAYGWNKKGGIVKVLNDETVTPSQNKDRGENCFWRASRVSATPEGGTFLVSISPSSYPGEAGIYSSMRGTIGCYRWVLCSGGKTNLNKLIISNLELLTVPLLAISSLINKYLYLFIHSLIFIFYHVLLSSFSFVFIHTLIYC